MRRPCFKGWVSRELAYLSGENTLNLRRLAFLAQGAAPRLRERLVLYAIATDKALRLKGFLYREDMIAEVDMLAKTLNGVDLDDPGQAECLALPDRYRKALLSYKTAYRQLETRNASKMLRREKSVELQKKKGISTARICRALGLDPGNTSSYLRDAEIDRVSLEKATDILRYLQKSP
ncbi:MAG: hypothetical protein FWG03_03075 [Clostridiales bacterium]|nr:hypothetical protein [Clostridiales bacterium]